MHVAVEMNLTSSVSRCGNESHKLGHSTKDIKFQLFKPLKISETEKFGKFYLYVFQSFTLAEKKIWG